MKQYKDVSMNGLDDGKVANSATFTLEDVQEVLKEKKQVGIVQESEAAEAISLKTSPEIRSVKSSVPPIKPTKVKKSAVSVLDILGFHPADVKGKKSPQQAIILKKFQPYFDRLTDMRDKLRERLQSHASEALRFSDVDAVERCHVSGQHTADGASEQEDLDRALSVVENEQELLSEVEAALKRIQEGTYGVCECTGNVIDGKRLDVLPFTRFSLEGRQIREREGLQKRPQSRGGALFLYGEEEIPSIQDQDAE